MDAYAAQKDRLAVEQNLISLHFNGAETDLVGEMIVSGGEFDFVEAWIFRRPGYEAAGMK